MLLTIVQNGRASTGGTIPLQQGSAQNIPPGAVSPIPSLPPTDATTGAYGGLLYICDAALAVGDIVFAYNTTSPDGIQRRYVIKAYGTASGPVLGVVASKTRADVAEVVHAGIVPTLSNLEQGQRYFLAADGTLLSPPLAQDPMTYVHYVGYAVAPDTLMVQPSYPLLKRAAS